MHVVDDSLDLRGESARYLEGLEVAVAVAKPERDHDQPALALVALTRREPVVYVGFAIGRKPSADDDAVERQGNGRPRCGRPSEGLPQHPAQVPDAALILEVDLDIDVADR